MANNFDDFGIDDFMNTDGQDLDDYDDGSDSIDVFNTGNNQGGNPKEVKKTAIVAIICGVLLIAVVFGVMTLLKSVRDKADNEQLQNEQTGQVEQIEQNTDVNQQPTQDVQIGVDPNSDRKPNTSQGNTNISSGGYVASQPEWVEFQESSDISFNSEYIDSTFTVTSVRHYLKVVDGSSNIEVKSVLAGALAGYGGTYELEVPYSLAIQIDPGLQFNVLVQIGATTDGKSVVGEIVYE